MRILSLDLGLRRIGVALSDGKTVASQDTIEYWSRDEAIQRILKICREEQIEMIVLGLPKSKSGEAEDMVRSFALEINKLLPIPIEFVDETLTSKESERILSGLKIDIKSVKYKREIDRISAKLILEQYLGQ
ncbi:MAG: Holliday junction resolvase RuvX [Candidatus Berkelbacteria bacterium]